MQQCGPGNDPQLIGGGEKRKIGRLIGNMTIMLAVMSAVFTLIVFGFQNQILGALNTPKESWDQALSYMLVCGGGIFFIAGYNAVSSVLRGMGDSRHPFYFIAAAALINIVLDILFVYVFDMESFGAALATVIGQGVSFVGSLVFLARRRTMLGFDITKDDLRPDKKMMLPLVRLAAPMSITSAAISISRLFVNSFVNSYGVAVSAITGIGLKFGTIANLFSSCFSTAGASMVGQNIGAEKYRRVIHVYFSVCIITGAIALVEIFAVTVFPKPVFSLFLNDDSLMGLAMEYVPVAVLSFIGAALRSGSFAIIHGSANPVINFFIAVIDGFIMRLGLSLLFGSFLGMGYFGFWIGDALSGWTPFFIGGIYLLTGKWKKKNAAVEA